MDTWWIDEPHLIGSCNPTLADLDELRRGGFSVLVSLLKEEEQVRVSGCVQHRRIGLPLKI
jgi:hypothetical protein